MVTYLANNTSTSDVALSAYNFIIKNSIRFVKNIRSSIYINNIAEFATWDLTHLAALDQLVKFLYKKLTHFPQCTCVRGLQQSFCHSVIL